MIVALLMISSLIIVLTCNPALHDGAEASPCFSFAHLLSNDSSFPVYLKRHISKMKDCTLFIASPLIERNGKGGRIVVTIPESGK